MNRKVSLSSLVSLVLLFATATAFAAPPPCRATGFTSGSQTCDGPDSLAMA